LLKLYIMRLPAIICFCFLLLGSCGNPSGGKKTAGPFTIASLKGPSSMGMIRLIDSLEGTTEAGLKVTIVNEPLQVRKMMLDGTADFALLPTTMAAIVYNKGLDYKLAAIPVWGTLYLFGRDTAITSWEDLRHKTVHVMARGMTPDLLFRYLLQKKGIDPGKDITLDYRFSTHIDLANAVASDQASLGVISEPLVSQVMHLNSKVKMLFDLNKEWISIQGAPIPQTALMVKSSVIQNNPALVEEVLDAFERSVEWVNSHPGSAAELIVRYGILDNPRIAYQAIPGSGLKLVRAAAIHTQITEYLRIFYEMDPQTTGGKMPDEGFYY